MRCDALRRAPTKDAISGGYYGDAFSSLQHSDDYQCRVILIRF